LIGERADDLSDGEAAAAGHAGNARTRTVQRCQRGVLGSPGERGDHPAELPGIDRLADVGLKVTRYGITTAHRD